MHFRILCAVPNSKASVFPFCKFRNSSFLLIHVDSCCLLYFFLSRLLYLAFSANLGLLCMPHPGMGPLV